MPLSARQTILKCRHSLLGRQMVREQRPARLDGIVVQQRPTPRLGQEIDHFLGADLVDETLRGLAQTVVQAFKHEHHRCRQGKFVPRRPEKRKQ
jgi:hypothetical protein